MRRLGTQPAKPDRAMKNTSSTATLNLNRARFALFLNLFVANPAPMKRRGGSGKR